MEDGVFPVQRSLLSASALAERVLPNYDLPGAPSCRFWQRGINDSYLVQAGQTRYVLRVAPANWRSYEHVNAEIDLLRFLCQHRMRVPQPVQQRDGAFVASLKAPEGIRHAVLFGYLPGATHEPSEAHSHRYGEAIAQLHRITDDYPPDRAGPRYGPVEMVDESLERLRPWLADRPDDWAYLQRVAGELADATGDLAHTGPEYGICHGDVNGGNMHYVGEDGWALLDFEYFGYGWRVFDIGTYYNNQIVQSGRTPQTRRVVDAFLAGYQTVRRLSQGELVALRSFVVMRQFWLLGVGARNVPNIGLEMFERWVLTMCMPFIRAWMDEPWV